MYKIFNKTYQPIMLLDGTRVPQRDSVTVERITPQLKNLEMKGLIIIKKV